MARGITDEDVWAAADALLRDGEQPTIERVRLHLGRGSPNTVGPHLKTWFKQLSERHSRLGGTEQGGASGLPAPLLRAAAQLWEMALASARDEWADAAAQERAALAKQRESLDAERAMLRQERDRLQAREADLQAAAETARSQAAAAEARLVSAETQARETRAALKDATSQLTDIRDRETRLQQALRDATVAHQDALAKAEARHAVHERRWLGELDELRQSLKQAGEDQERARKAAEAAAAKLRTRIEQAESEADAQAQRAQAAESTVQTLIAQLDASIAATETERSLRHDTTAQLLGQLGSLNEQLAGRDRQIDQLLAQQPRKPAARKRRP
ncbi:cointegrate resolution protein [Bordetella ansorpii]|uniref:Cointegrate resolution protein n=1 Tax=Bordetella ansorpii TaxID=288768 RepID=A0A157SL38_9BORD|nr:DNA-binding protein [Bordetella ansorpii]SAI71014.1 cointegrate resolution protein [Bordetella ansorpii]